MKTTSAIWDGAGLRFENITPPAGVRVSVSWADEDEGEVEGPGVALLRLVEELNEQFPPDPDTPSDLAAQHDHYLHGQPKRADNDFR